MGRWNQNTGTAMIPKPEQRRWASKEAVIKAEISDAKNTGDLLRMANAIVRLDALHAEIEAAAKSGLLRPDTELAPDKSKDFRRD